VLISSTTPSNSTDRISSTDFEWLPPENQIRAKEVLEYVLHGEFDLNHYNAQSRNQIARPESRKTPIIAAHGPRQHEYHTDNDRRADQMSYRRERAVAEIMCRFEVPAPALPLRRSALRS
jgi:hypothetical protein